MKKRYLIFLFLMACRFFSSAEPVAFKTETEAVSIRFYAEDIVRVSRKPVGKENDQPGFVVQMNPEAVELTKTEHEGLLTLSTKRIRMSVDLKTGQIDYALPDGTPLVREAGARFSPYKTYHRIAQTFILDPAEAVYGLGQQQRGKMNQRNQTLELDQQNTRVCIPFIQSIKGYGIYWDQYSISEFTDNSSGLTMQSLGNCADYYFLYGGNADGVIRLMRNLTGQAPMIPLWGFGFFQCRERYKTQEEIIGVVEKYRELEVPLDCVIQDWQYWGNNDNWNSMGFDPSRFPDPKKMADTIHRMNSKIMISVWPSFGVSTELFQAYSNNNMLIDIKTWPMNCPARSYDAYNPKARDMYWDKLNQEIFSLGFDALWLDGVEPIHKNPEPQDFDVMTHAGAFERVKNVYPLLTCEGVYKNWRKTTAEKRVLLLPRSGFAGQQRTGSVVWSGDVQSEWSVLRKQISAGLNFSLCAAPYWNTDIGGFFAGRFNTCTPGAGASVQEQELASEKKPFYTHGGEKNPEFQELYVRWMQFGAFTPVMRSHGTFVPREIYQFGERGEWPFDIQEQYINLRYSLLPYIYSTAWDVTCNAGTFMRALMMDFPADSNVWDLDDEYLFGRSILVAPVTEFGQTEKKVYLPKGSAWYDFWTFEKFEGGTETVKAAPKDVLPLFVRAGSIIPRGPKVQYSTEKDWSVLDIHLYPGANGEFVLYEDEFDNYNYESGCYSEIRMLWNEQEQTLTICDRKGTFRGMLTCRRFNLHFPGQEAKSCVYSGSEVKIPF